MGLLVFVFLFESEFCFKTWNMSRARRPPVGPVFVVGPFFGKYAAELMLCQETKEAAPLDPTKKPNNDLSTVAVFV